jgi:hypothetical protein
MAMASSDSPGGGGDRDVFGSLPNTRPQRRSVRRDRARARAKPAAGTRPAAQVKSAAGTKPAARAKPASRAKPAAQAKPAAGAKPAAQAKPGARPKPAAQAQAEAAASRAAAAAIPPAGYATPRDNDDGVPHGVELVTTAVQAAGELAHIGLAAGGRAVKSALGRLPRP